MVDGTGLENRQVNASQVRILSLPPEGNFIKPLGFIKLAFLQKSTGFEPRFVIERSEITFPVPSMYGTVAQLAVRGACRRVNQRLRGTL